MKNLFIFLLIFLFARSATGQASAGIKIGGNYFNIGGAGKGEYQPGYEAGFFSKAEVGKKISLMPELDYGIKKSKVTLQDTAYTIELNFARFRISVTYDFTENLFAGIGPDFAYMINPVQKPQLIDKTFFTHFAVGMNPFVGAESGRFLFLLRYEWGLTFLTLEDTPEASGNPLTGARFNGFCWMQALNFKIRII